MPPSGQKGSRKPGDPARLAAFEVVKAVRVEDAYANLVLPHVLARLGLEGRDAAFATELASGTLRQQGTYDAVLAACIDRPLAKVESKVLDLLRLGAHQLLSMRVPDHAAISTTVDLVRSRSGPGAGGFANAVLRKVAARTLEEWIDEVAPARDADPVGWASVAFSHPRWEVELLGDALAASPPTDPEAGAGERRQGAPDGIEALLAADNAPPRVTLVARPGRGTVEELVAEGGEPTAYSPFGVVAPAGSPTSLSAVSEGRAGVQDEGSQLVAIALAEAPARSRPVRGEATSELWLDLCAGPGGKSALLAALAAERGASLVANESQPHRAGLVRRNLALVPREEESSHENDHRIDRSDDPAAVLVPGAVGVVAADGTRPPFRSGSFDRVLVDAPCTGLGALRRRPEARWRRREQDVVELVPLQQALLASALDLVRPGGVVLYATCSPVLAETRGVVESVLAARRDVDLEPVAGTLATVPDSAGPVPGTVQLWPHRHGTDAMFMARLRRR
ncbi:MAG: rRNA cytosine-C5-methyltransferase [Nocardioides sp.]|nr:rRNA cytosine-C5-methyltransferase [Nocardioides sp.]